MHGLSPEIRSRRVDGVNGLSMHCLEAGEPGRPCVLLLHGFPELAYSWRKVMAPIAAAGYYVVAPDQRGYGKTTGWDGRYDGDLAPYRMLSLVQDCLSLISKLGVKSVHVVGHDFGAPLAAYCALTRPDVFRSLVMMSAPFGGPPAKPLDTRILDDLAKIGRKHYHWYYSTRHADGDMRNAPQGVHAFLRAYYHYKSADWSGNRPHRLESWSAGELAKLPTYYVMRLDETMAQTVAPHWPVRESKWLTDAELAVYADAFRDNGFQGGLQWYRCRTTPGQSDDVMALAGRAIDVPAMFIAGAADWGVRQKPGDFERMQGTACTRMLGCHLISGAGHWVQQEQPERTAALLVDFLSRA